MRSALLLVAVLLLSTLVLEARGQNVYVATSADETLAGQPIALTLRFEKGHRGKIVGFRLKVFVPKDWKKEVIELEVINPEGEYLSKSVKVINDTIFEYHGEEVSAGHMTIKLTPPVYSPTKTYKFEVAGYLELDTPSGIQKAYVTGEAKVLVRHWEPFVMMNLSKGVAIPPDIVVVYVKVTSAPPLPKADMRDVNVLITSSVTGVVFNKTILYWPYGHPAAIWRIPIKVDPDTKPGEHLIKVKVSYTLGENRYSTEVNGSFFVEKPSVLRAEKVSYTKEVSPGKLAWVNLTLVNPSPFPAYDVEVHVKLGKKHRVKTIKELDAGQFKDMSFKFKPEELNEGKLPLQAWLVWKSEYPREARDKTFLNATVRVISGSGIDYNIVILAALAVLGVATVKYVVKRGRGKEVKGAGPEEGVPEADQV